MYSQPFKFRNFVSDDVVFLVKASVVEVLGVMEAKGEKAEQATEQLERLLFILQTLVSHKNGAKVTKPDSVCQVRVPHTHRRHHAVICFVWLHNCISPCLQTVLRLVQSSSLSPSCSRLLLQITSSLLLGENISLPRVLIQETVQKVCGWCKSGYIC